MADIKVPTLGESVTEATVGRWFKQPGEAVAADEQTAARHPVHRLARRFGAMRRIAPWQTVFKAT